MAALRQSRAIIDGSNTIGDWTPAQLQAFITNLLHVEPSTLPTSLHIQQLTLFDQLQLSGDTKVGFFAATPTTQPTVSGSKGANAALASLLTALVALGLVIDTTT